MLLPSRDITQPRDSKLLHLNRKLKKVIQAAYSSQVRDGRFNKRPNLPLTLRFCLVYCLPPDVHAMPPHQHRVSIRIPVHCFLQALRQILFMGRVLDHRDPQRIVIPQAALLLEASPEPLDLLNIIDLKDLVIQRPLLKEQSNEDGPLGMRMYAAPGSAFREGSNEEWGALGGLESGGRSEVDSLLGIQLLGEFEHVDVFGLHELFLHARRREVDEVTAGAGTTMSIAPFKLILQENLLVANARSSASACRSE